MRVFIVKNDKEETDKFMKIVEEQLNEYGIEFQIITSSNVSINKRRLDSSSLVVVCNGSRYKDDIESFIEEAVQKEAEIWPIAINKEDRLPEGDRHSGSRPGTSTSTPNSNRRPETNSGSSNSSRRPTSSGTSTNRGSSSGRNSNSGSSSSRGNVSGRSTERSSSSESSRSNSNRGSSSRSSERGSSSRR